MRLHHPPVDEGAAAAVVPLDERSPWGWLAWWRSFPLGEQVTPVGTYFGASPQGELHIRFPYKDFRSSTSALPHQ